MRKKKLRVFIESVVDFAGHVVVGAINFGILVAPAVGLDFGIRWLAKHGVSEGVICILTIVKYAIFLIDSALLVGYILLVAARKLRHTWDNG